MTFDSDKKPAQLEQSGVLVVNKPAGITSAGVVARLKKITGAKKAGHTGTLDPFATGILICCVNRATRLAGFFLHGRKTYRGLLFLGRETDTFDATGATTSTCDDLKVSDKEIESVFKRFEGASEQLPPVYSALKHKGVPLYKLARIGKPVQKPARQVFISKLSILDIDLPAVRFEASCSAGTYIRTLCSDIGKALGCGGHLEALNRIECGGFTLDDAVTLEVLEKLAISGKLSDKLISMNDALKGMTGYMSDNRLAGKILTGQPIWEEDLNCPHPEQTGKTCFENHIKIIDPGGNLIAVLRRQKTGKPYYYSCVFHPENQ